MLKKTLLALAVFFYAVQIFAYNEPLEPEQAFKLSVRAIDTKTLEARWQIADGYYLYRNKFRFEAKPATARLEAPQMAQGMPFDDEFFGKVEIYRKEARVLLPLEVPAGTTSITLKATSQGCADMGICYPPLPQQVKVKLKPTPVTPSVTSALPLPRSLPAATPSLSTPPLPAIATDSGDESSRVARLLKNASVWTILLFFFGSGLALAFTPCVLPMLPILSGIIAGHGHGITRKRAFALSLAYVLGMALTYAALGVAAGFSGTLLSGTLQNPWVLGGFAGVFVLLALSMFGCYELQLPSFLQSKLAEEANRQKGGFVPSVMAMGALSAAIVGPCVAAPLAGALLYIAKTGDAVLGGSALFIMALGMGLPLVIVGTSARHLLPRPGPWMEAVKRFFGLILLGVAVWLVSPVIPPFVQMLAWAALLIIPAIFLRALDPLPPRAHGWQKFGKGIGIFLLLAGAALLLGAFAGSRDPLQPLDFVRAKLSRIDSGISAPDHEFSSPRFTRVKTSAELDTLLKSASKPVMLDFYADWCITCKQMERFTFSDAAVVERLSRMRLLKVDVTANSEEDKALLKQFQLFGPPAYVFFNAGGGEIPDLRVVGFQDAAAFKVTLNRALQ